MNKIYEKYLDNILDAMKSNSKHKMMIIRHYNAFEFYKSEEIMHYADDNGIYIVNHRFSHDVIDNPFEPFLGWIKERVNAEIEDIDDFLEKMNVYSMHKSIFKTYFKYSVCCRYEEFIDHSYTFEKGMIYKALISMLNYFTKDKTALFVLDKMHCIELSTMKLLKEIIDKVDGIYVITAYNDSYPIRAYIKSIWEKNLDIYEEAEFVVDYADIYGEAGTGKNVVEKSTDWNLDAQNVKSIMLIIHNKIQFLAYEESVYYLEIVYDKLNLEKIELDSMYKYVLYEMFVKTLFILAKFNHENNFYTLNDVLLICDKMKEICSIKKDTIYRYVYNYNIAKVYTFNGQDKNCKHYANEAVKLAKKMREEVKHGEKIGFVIDDFLEMYGRNIHEYAHICQLYAEALVYKTRSELYLYNPDRKDIPMELIDDLSRYGLFDHLAETLNHSCEREREIFKSVENIKERAPMLDETIKIGNMIGNKAFMRSFYRANMMRASNAGYYDTADYFCERVLEVVADDEMQVAYTYMGRGYNCCTVEKYKEAHEYFCRALTICYKYHDVKHIAEIMYNIGLNCMLASYYEKAVDYLSCALKILDKLNIPKLFACSRVKINALRILCYFKLNKEYLCNFEFKKVARNIDFKFFEYERHSKYIEEKFLYHYIKGMLDLDKEDYLSAEQDFIEAEVLIEQIEGVKFCYYTMFMRDKIRLLKGLGRNSGINKIVSDVVDFCDEHKYEDKKNRFFKWFNNEVYEVKKFDFSLIDITFAQVYEATEMEKNQNLIEEKRNEEEFLTKWQNIMSNPGRSINDFIDRALNSYIYNYDVDGIVMLRMNNKNISAITKNMENVLPRDSINKLWKFFDENSKEAFLMTADDKNYDEYNNISMLFGEDKIYSIFGVPFRINNQLEYVFYAYNTIKSRLLSLDNGKIYFMKADNIDVYVRLFRQFIDGIDSMEKTIKINAMNDKLKYYAHTDMLTGLLNRKGLEEKLKDMFFGENEEDDTKLPEKNDKSNGVLGDEKSKDEADNGRTKAKKIKPRSKFYTVMYIDLDNFKYYNDTFGHEIGDLVLKKFSEILQHMCLDFGVAVRYGGDEFLAVLTNMDRNKINEFANSIFESIENENYFIDDIAEELNEYVVIEPKYRLSCSIGIANFKVTGEDAMSEYIKAVDNADKALYHVKKTTKGTFSFYAK